MNREIFLETLRKALYGKISENDLAEHMRYYENYFVQETSRGRKEQEVLEELGDPRLIARTIIETSGVQTAYRREYTVSEDDETDVQPDYRIRRLEGWKAKAMMAAVVAAIVLSAVAVFHLVVAMLPFLIVAGVIIWAIKKFQS